jgi:hypothetical protein
MNTHDSPPVTLGNKEKILLNQPINFNRKNRKYGIPFLIDPDTINWGLSPISGRVPV